MPCCRFFSKRGETCDTCDNDMCSNCTVYYDEEEEGPEVVCLPCHLKASQAMKNKYKSIGQLRQEGVVDDSSDDESIFLSSG